MTGLAADPREQLKTGKDREKMVVRSEIVHCYEELASSVAAYRSGYLADDRRGLESGLRDGRITGMASTLTMKSR